MFDLNKITKPNIKSLEPYTSARDEFSGSEGVFLDANENPYGELNRYPDPFQRELKEVIGETKSIDPSKIFIGNGSDEVIDLLFRIFCNPGTDRALTFSPTYGMYDVSAAINDVEMIKIELDDSFEIDFERLKPYLRDEKLKLILICSPNNPTGNCFDSKIIEKILNQFNGIVLVDEAYIDFSSSKSLIENMDHYPNLVVSQTMSKARGLAAARIGMAFTNPDIISLMNKVKPPYNISALNQKAAIESFRNNDVFEENVKKILDERDMSFGSMTITSKIKVYPSDANFLLVEVPDANQVYEQLVAKKIIVRNRNSVVRNCIRITIGTPEENKKFIDALKEIEL